MCWYQVIVAEIDEIQIINFIFILKVASKMPVKVEAYIKTEADAQRFFKENKGKDLFPEKTSRMKKLLENVK